MKKGKIYYSLYIDDETLKHEWSEWHVTSVRVGKVYLRVKSSLTWGKLSNKNGDYGWLSYIPKYCQYDFTIGSKPYGIFTTKLQAWRHEYHKFKNNIEKNYYEDNTIKLMKNKFKRIKP